MYSARITRHTPTAFVLLIDHSGSMEEKMMYGNMLATKAEVVAIVTNRLLEELVNRCRKDDGIVNYFDIAAIGYSGDKARMLLNSDTFTTPTSLVLRDCRKRIITQDRHFPDGTVRSLPVELKYWVEPKAEGNTPMRSALEMALRLLDRWCRRPDNAMSYPPTVFNITDGEATDGDHGMLCNLASEIKQLGTRDGNVLLININISSSGCQRTVVFPGSKEELPDSPYTNLLYDMSSEMPAEYSESIQEIKPGSTAPYRGMSLNTTAANLISMMDIGSRSINKLV